MVVLGEVSRGRDNNLNLIRMLAALGVLISHAWPLALGPTAVEPLESLLGFSLGHVAVLVFFAISGFLIPRSFQRQPTLAAWLQARFLRLFPALVVVLMLTVAVLGPLVTTLPLAEYVERQATLAYVPRNLSLYFRQFDLPGVFATNPYPNVINGSLWTLFYEVACYAGVMALGLAGLLCSRGRMLVVFGLFLAFYLALSATPLGEMVPGRLRSLIRLGLPFAIGTGFYVWQDRLPLHPGLLLAFVVLTTMVWDTALGQVLFVFTLAYAVFLLAYLPGGWLLGYNRIGDFSYGTYIYAFPVQQLSMYFAGPVGPLANIAIALPATLVLAVISWFWIERPALSWAGARRRPVRSDVTHAERRSG
jgi:peptidoglycan/LPS O-acetylase OafA/YrhL